MKILIDEKTSKGIQDILSKKDKPYVIRIYMTCFAWDGPGLEMALYEPLETDNIIEVNNIKFFLDKDVTSFKSDIEVFTQNERFGGGYAVKYTGILI